MCCFCCLCVSRALDKAAADYTAAAPQRSPKRRRRKAVTTQDSENNPKQALQAKQQLQVQRKQQQDVEEAGTDQLQALGSITNQIPLQHFTNTAAGTCGVCAGAARLRSFWLRRLYAVMLSTLSKACQTVASGTLTGKPWLAMFEACLWCLCLQVLRVLQQQHLL